MDEIKQYKFKESTGAGGAFAKYRKVYYGDLPLGRMLLGELLTTLLGWIPGALGLFLRSKLYPLMFDRIGRKVVFGRDITIRHPHKIAIGDNVSFDDNSVIDAKGDGNEGIRIGANVYIGRNSIIYCKGGDIFLGESVNISSNCQLFSSNKLEIGAGTIIGGFTYILSGGEYDYNNSTPFAQQNGMESKGPLKIGRDCWLGARTTVLDGVQIGERCVIAAGAVVNKPLEAKSIAAGIPAKTIKKISIQEEGKN